MTEDLNPRELFDQTIASTLKILRHLKSSDFDSENGTNETGFKNIVISALHHILDDKLEGSGCQILSEHEIEWIHSDTKQSNTNFADIVVKVGDRFGLIIELKYIQAPFLEGYYKKMPFVTANDKGNARIQKIKKRREALTSLASEIAKKSSDELRELNFFEKFETENKYSVRTREQSAIEQVTNYKNRIEKPNPQFTWYTATIVGVVSNLVFHCIDF